MSYLLTFVAPQHTHYFEKTCHKAVDDQKLTIIDHDILANDKALDVILQDDPTPYLNQLRETLKCDVFVQTHAPQSRKKKLLLSDMDATIVAEETLDELAASLGLKEKIAEITAATMRGELDFEASVKQRVAMLKNLPLIELEKTAQHLTYSKGAKTLITTLKAHNVHTVLVSGGFTYFTNYVAQHIGFHENFGNILGTTDTHLDGQVIPPIRGKEYKAELLKSKMKDLNLNASESCCIGDGANDLDMLSHANDNAGLGVGFQSKPLLREKLPNHIIYGDLTTLLYAQGYKQEDIIQEDV